jgi:CxxC-x17-CxxC domain-containing protein
MHQAICSSCGKECEVPFKPSGDKPVYCRDCFAKNRSHESESFGREKRDNRETPRGDFKRFNEDRPSPAPRNNDLGTINSKLDQILKILNSQTETLAPAEIPTEEIAIKKKKASKKVVSTPEETTTE